MTLDLKLARATGQDAANRAMRAAGRGAWEASDRDIAAQTTTRLLQAPFQAGGLDDAARDTAVGLTAAGAQQRRGQR